MTSYYNEIDPYAAQWLRNLIAAGHIPAGDVDERDIKEVKPADLRRYTQCHFFAGIGGWSRALRLAEWADDRPVWTGSCPCQPFSTAGRGLGAADERHLWPTWFELIRECKPSIIFGEQVASPAALGWWDSVQDDLEGADYASAAFDLCAAGASSPHIRQRLYWMAESNTRRRGENRKPGMGREMESRPYPGMPPTLTNTGFHERVADTECGRRPPCDKRRFVAASPQESGGGSASVNARILCPETVGLADSDCERCRREHALLQRDGLGREPTDCIETAGDCEAGVVGVAHDAGPQRRLVGGYRPHERIVGTSGLAGFWSDAEWVYCRDKKYRPVESGTFPLAHGVSGRVGRLRAYGNAIVPPIAAEFVKAYMDARP